MGPPAEKVPHQPDCVLHPPRVQHLNDGSAPTASEEKQIDIPDSLSANNRNDDAPSYTNFKVPPAHAFSSERYGAWRREFISWRELYIYVTDLHLMSILGLHSDSALKQLPIKFHHQTRDSMGTRTLSNFPRMLDEYYSLASQERESKQLDRLMELRKSPSENMVSFWLRYEQILYTLDGSSSHLSASFLFIRALKSLDLNDVQRTSIMTLLECQTLEQSWKNIKKKSAN